MTQIIVFSIMKWGKEFVEEFYYLFSEMAPYLLIGFLFAGLLRAFLPQKNIEKYLGKPGFKSSFLAALAGVPMPLCSCGVIPTGVSLYRNGATKGATTSFFISTPQTGVDSIFATYALLGLPFAIIRPIVAFVTGIFGGLLSQFAEKKQLDPDLKSRSSEKPDERLSFLTKTKIVFSYGFGELIEDIVKWLMIGLLIATLLSVLIPESFFSQYIGNQFLEMGIVLIASVPLYICATGSIPLAAVLLLKGLSPGAALVLLMAGPATNVATMTVIGQTMGKRSLITYLTAIVGGALISGYLINTLLPEKWFLIGEMEPHLHGFLPNWIGTVAAALLGLLIVYAIYKRYFRKQTVITQIDIKDMPTKIKIEGMTCHHCEASVSRSLKELEGVESVEVNLGTGEALLKGNYDLHAVERAIESIGYKFKGVESN